MKKATEEVLLERIEQLESDQQVLRSQLNETMVTLIKTPKQPQRPDMFWRQVKMILAEGKPDTPTRLMTFLASFAKDNDMPDGAEIHQLAGNIYKRYYC